MAEWTWVADSDGYAVLNMIDEITGTLERFESFHDLYAGGGLTYDVKLFDSWQSDVLEGQAEGLAVGGSASGSIFLSVDGGNSVEMVSTMGRHTFRAEANANDKGIFRLYYRPHKAPS